MNPTDAGPRVNSVATAESVAGDVQVNPASAPHTRARLIVAVVIAAWLVLASRLVHVQVIRQPDFAHKAVQQRLFVEQIAARPGDIIDRHGRLLATSIATRSLFVDPARIRTPWQTSLELADAVNLPADQLFERLARHADRRFLWIKRRLTEEEVQRVRDLKLPPEIWGFREEYLRQYPQGPLAAHVLGMRDIDGQGRGGVEQQLDRILRGRHGRRVLERDALGRVLFVREEIDQQPQDGQIVQLTLDSVIQLYVERAVDNLMEEWRPDSACAIVMEPQTGELLAMCSRPGFNPNQPADVPNTAWKNRAIAAQFEPGSTIKPFVLGWALDRELIVPEERFYCEQGVYRMGRRLLHDHHSYGWLSVEDVLVKSSNIGMAKIGERLGNAELHAALQAFGFGRPTGIELAGELNGTLRPLEQWNDYSTGSIPMGQELAVTPIQLLTAHAALANGGKLTSPRLTLSIGNNPTTSTRLCRPCLSFNSSKWLVTEAMRQVVERGTGKQAQIENLAVFGKTGTAQKVDPDTGGYSHSQHVCSFVAGAPADDPRVLVLVMVDHPTVGSPHYGGTVAAPAARRILELAHRRIPGPVQQAERTR